MTKIATTVSSTSPPAGAAPLPDALLDELAAKIGAGTTVAGIGESTRFSRETFAVRDQIFRRLARRHEFRALALQDHAAAAAKLDRYVTTGDGTAGSALDDAWRPWRTAEMAAALEWIREFNRDHPDDLIRIFGVKPAQAQPADYDAQLWADTISGYQRRTGVRVAYWDGIAHTAASPATLGLDPERGPQPTAGGLLRRHYGAGYASVAIGFHHGELGIATVPDPAADLLDAKLGAPRLPFRWLDLRSGDVRRLWDGAARLRVIGGVYDPSRDAAEHMAVASLADAFDILIHIRQATPVRSLP